VEFFDSGALRLGYVRKREQRKVQVVDQRGRHSTVPASRIVVIHEAIPEEDFPRVASRIEQRVAACVSEIDVALLWEAVHTQKREFTARELAEAYFGQVSPEGESAIYRKLSGETLFFRRTQGGFEARTEARVSAERLRLAREEQHEIYRQAVTRVLCRALEEGSTPEVMEEEEEWPRILERLEKWLRRGEADEAGDALATIVGEARSRPTAYDLLVRHGRVASDEDRFLLLHGVPTAFPREVVEASRRLGAGIDPGARLVWPGEQTFAIDDASTVEIDDAFTVHKDGNEIVVGIHIADVAQFVSKDDSLDREAHRRSSTIYLPNVSVMMFPPRLATDLASLVEGSPRPAISVEARFSDAGALLSFRFFRSVISVTDRMEYSGADQALADGNAALATLHAIAGRLRQERVAQGAQTHRRPDIKVHVTGDTIRVERLEADTPARLIVSEMMILTNRLAATHAASSGIPIIFRTQEPPAEPRPEIEGLPEAIQFELLRKNFKRSRLSLHPSPHAGLGLACYTQMSSPIRRYADLITQRQFVAALERRSLPYEREELLELMTSCEARELEVRRMEQSSSAWWILTYLSRERLNEPLEAIVVDRKGTVELTDFLVRAKLRDREELVPGAIAQVEIESVDPAHGSIRLRARS
jgi:exoribonuclease-2